LLAIKIVVIVEDNADRGTQKLEHNNKINVKLNQDQTNLTPMKDRVDFNWDFPDDVMKSKTPNPQDDVSEFTLPLKGALQKQVVTTFIFPIIFALIVGSALGVLGLNILKKQVNEEDLAVMANAPSSPETVTAGKSGETYEKNLKVSLIQAGVFSTNEAAESQQKQLPKKVPSVIIPQDDQFFLFIGATDSLEHAKVHAEEFQKQKIDAYWKDFEIQGATNTKLSADEQKVVEQVVKNFPELLAGLASEKMNEHLNEMFVEEIDDSKLKGEVAELAKKSNEMLALYKQYRKEESAAKLREFEQKLLLFVKDFQAL